MPEFVATARGPDKVAQAIELGADIGVDSRTQDFGLVAKAAGGIDVALDMIGAPFFDTTLDALNTGGRIVYIAALGGPILQVPVSAMTLRKRAIITGSTLRPRDADEKARLAREVRNVVWPWIREGRVKAVIDRVFPLADASEAHAFFEQGRHTGKVVAGVEGQIVRARQVSNLLDGAIRDTRTNGPIQRQFLVCAGLPRTRPVPVPRMVVPAHDGLTIGVVLYQHTNSQESVMYTITTFQPSVPVRLNLPPVMPINRARPIATAISGSVTATAAATARTVAMPIARQGRCSAAAEPWVGCRSPP